MSDRKRPTIAIFHCGFVYSGGGERIVLEEARGLQKRGYRVQVYAPTIDYKLCYPALVKELDVKMFLPSFIDWLPFRDAIRMATTSLLAPMLAFKFRSVDIFIGANQPGAWIAFCIAKVFNKPYLVYLNQPNRLIYPRSIDKLTGWQNRRDYYLLATVIRLIKPFVAWADRISFTSAKVMLVNGHYIGQSIKKAYGKKIVDCPAGAYPQSKRELIYKMEELYQGKIKIKNYNIKKPYLLLTNRHEPQKRFDYVIKALKKVVNKYPKVKLVIPGPFTIHTKDLQKLSKDLKVDQHIIFTGQISEKDLQKLYRQSAIYCYPSPDEDYGLGPLEAAAWGVPTVAWNHGGPTVTVRGGVTGFLARPYNIYDYADKILTLLANPRLRNQMGKAAYNLLDKQFSWDNHFDILEKEIRKLV